METEAPRSITLIWPDLVRRFRAPCGSVTFYAYLFLGVLLCGGCGIWVAIIKGSGIEGISAALLTYFPALVGAAVLDFTQESQTYLRFFGLGAGGVFVVVVALAATSAQGWQFFWSLLGAILSIGFWWVANGPNRRFDDVKPDAATGGTTSQGLQGSGNKGFQV